MKTFKFKKTWAGLTVILLLTIFVVLSKSTLAASSPPAQITVGQTTYTAAWVDRSSITITATQKSGGKTTSTTLTDGQWSSNWDYTGNTTGIPGSQCGTMEINGFGSAIVGMTSRSGRGTWEPSDSYGQLTITNANCQTVVNKQQITIGQSQNASISFKATASDTIQVIDQAQSQSLTFNTPRLQSDGTVRYYLGGQTGDTCQEIIAVNFNSSAIDNGLWPAHQMEFFEQKTDGTYASPVSSNCKLDYTAQHSQGMPDSDTISANSYPLENFSTLQKPSQAQAGNGSSGTNCDPSTDSSCQQATSASDCVFNSNSGSWAVDLNWILCPVIQGLSASADAINGFVSGQLNFDISQNLPSGGAVQKAWATFKDLASAVIVVVLLVMVISQAIGGGPFDAYTIRKMLPKLVVAVIIMQISWYLCVYLIGLANDAGQGVAQLMAAPFGGLNALELPDLLYRLSSVWAAIVGVGTTATLAAAPALIITGVVGAGTLLSFGWPILVLALILIVITVIVALATLLVRNALIVLLVILSPLAFIAWVLPGMDRYWKMWKDNFIRVLVFFPLVMAMIYGGRIFAWTVGNLGGSAGPLDLIMVLVGFFGPYFFLPKAFKWAGPLLASAANGINNAWPVKKGREVATKELMAAQKRKQNALVDKYYQSLVRSPDGSPPPGIRQRAGAGLKRGLIRTAGGHPIPTKRATRVMMQEAGKWKEEEIALGEGKINNDYKEFQKGDPSKGIAPMSVQDAKKATRAKHYDPTGKDALNNRAFFTWAYDTKSFMEMGDKDWRTSDGKHEDMFKTQGWIDFMHGNPNAYADFSSRLGASSVPYRLPLGGGPQAEDYLTGGKRYEILGQETVQDADGKVIPNVHYNPGLKKLIDDGDPRASHLAELEADSERFTKLIDQAEDPAAVVAQRPEEFEQLKKVTAELEGAGVSSVGKLSLKNFIEKESTTLGGRNLMQRLTGAAQPHIDAMLGDGYIQSKIAPRRGDPDDLGGGGSGGGGGGGGNGGGGGGNGGGGGGNGGGGGGGNGGGGGGGNGGSGSRTAATPQTTPGSVPYAQPIELKIDHDALYDTIRRASKQGTIEGRKHDLDNEDSNEGPKNP